MLAELQVSQDELRRNREWRWRAERLLAGLQRGTLELTRFGGHP
jgi:hypothetical protein